MSPHGSLISCVGELGFGSLLCAGPHAGTSLFRVNSTSTKLMGAFGKLYGIDYLKGMLSGVITTMCGAAKSYEVPRDTSHVCLRALLERVRMVLCE